MSDLVSVTPAQEAPRTPKPWLFTRETAKLNGDKGRATLLARLAAKRAEKERPTPPPPPDAPELTLVLAECERVSVALSDMKLKPADRCALAKTLDMLLDRARIIRGLALPGTVSSRAPAPPASQASSMLGLTAPATSPEAARPTRDEQE